jgi:hypothetical protein
MSFKLDNPLKQALCNLKKGRVVEHVSPVEGVITIAPCGCDTVYVVPELDNTESSPELTLVINDDNSKIGDHIIIQFRLKVRDNNYGTINFNPDKVYITHCGGFSPNSPIYYRMNLVFVYDGDMWLNTYDNC